MSAFFTSDNHFSHTAIVGYCERPFRDVEEMNEEMVRRWNEVVRPTDHVYHLGDFALGPSGTAARWRARLNGDIVLLRGNHDRSRKHMLAAGFEVVQHDMHVLALPTPPGEEGLFIYLRHRPPQNDAWRTVTAAGRKIGTAIVCFHGHVHRTYARRGDLFNVGADVRDFRPVTMQQILETKDENHAT